MADPVWSGQYNYAQTPEQNGFTRVLYNAPVITLVTGGTPASRRVEVTSNAGDAVFQTTSVPALSVANGATVQIQVQVSGAGDAGYELTFQQLVFQVQVYANRVTVTVPDGTGEHQVDSNDNSAATVTVRSTVDATGVLRTYRNTVLIDTRQLPANTQPFQRVLWWGEGGGLQTFRQMAYYTGGPVAP